MAGLLVISYPTISNCWNSFHSTQLISEYTAVQETEAYEELFAEAGRYNAALRELRSPLLEYEQISGYDNTLDISGTGIMGYVMIPKIQVELPVYHGTSEGVLQIAAGHIEGTSLPIGGETTHSAFSAHRGLASARLFTDLNQLETGDHFTLTVLDRILTYRVQEVLVVEPTALDALAVKEGQDLCTLVTCTPYGINSHRLLVRGERIEIEESAAEAVPCCNTVYRLCVLVVLILLLAAVLVMQCREVKIGGKCRL